MATNPALSTAAFTWIDNSPYEIWVQPTALDGTPSGACVHIGPTLPVASWVGWVDIAMDGLGTVGVAWEENTFDNDVWGWTWADPEATGIDNWQGEVPRLAGFPSGGFVVVFPKTDYNIEGSIQFAFFGL
ncbi:MAG: hypothetical protein ABI333_10325 [bacterium]